MAVSDAELAILITAKDRASGTIDKVGGKFGKFGKAAKLAKIALLGIGIGGLAAAAGLFKVGADFDKAFDTIRVGTGATGKVFKTLKGDLKSVFKAIPTDMTKAANAITQFNTLTGATGKTLQNMSKTALEAARILGEDSVALIGKAGKAFNVFEIRTEDASKALDAVFKASQLSNVPMTTLLGTLQTYGPVLKNLGFGLEESTAFFASLEKAGIDVSRVMPGLNAFMRKLADEGVTDLSAALDDQIEKIKGAETASEALNLATIAFGAEGAQRLSIAIRTGALDLEDFTKELALSEGVILSTARETESLGEKFTRFKNVLLVGVQPAATALFDGLGKLAGVIEEKVVPAVQSFIDSSIAPFLRDEVLPPVQSFAAVLKDDVLPALKSFAEDAGPLALEFLSGVADTIAIIMEATVLPAFALAWDDIKVAIVIVAPKIAQVLGSIAKNKTAVKAVAVALVTMAGAFVAFQTGEFIQEIASAIAALFTLTLTAGGTTAALAAVRAALITTGIGALFILMGLAIFLAIENWDKIVALWEDNAIPVLRTVGRFLEDHKLIVAAIAAPILLMVAPWLLVVAAIILVITKFDEIKALFTKTIPAAIDSVITKIEEIPVIGAIFQTTFAAIKIIVETVFALIKILIETTIAVIKDVIKIGLALIRGDWDEVWNGIKQLVVDVLNGIITAVELILGGFGELLKTLIFGGLTALAELLPILLQAGKDLGAEIMKGIGAGIDAGIGLVNTAFNGLISLFEKGINFIIGKWNDLEFKVSGPFGIGSATIGTPNIPLVSIPRLAAGAFIPPGVVTPAILHGGRFGEDVTPRLRPEAGGGKTIIVNIHDRAAATRRQARRIALDVAEALQAERLLN